MSKNGYICLFRKLQDHFLWKEKRVFSRLEAWIDILFEVRYSEEPEEKLIKDEIFIVNQGESIKSLDTWSKRWNWNKSRTRRYFELLKQCNMIETIGEQKTTHLKVLNYAHYRGLMNQSRNDSETNLKQFRNNFETILTPEEKGNKEKKENNILNEVIELLKESNLPNIRSFTDKRKKHLKARINESKEFQTVEFWEKFVEIINNSDFLSNKIESSGKHSNFKVDIDWVLNQNNFNKILEGKYSKNKVETQENKVYISDHQEQDDFIREQIELAKRLARG